MLYSIDNMQRSDDAADGLLEAKPFGTRLSGPASRIAPPNYIFGIVSRWLLGLAHDQAADVAALICLEVDSNHA